MQDTVNEEFPNQEVEQPTSDSTPDAPILAPPAPMQL